MLWIWKSGTRMSSVEWVELIGINDVVHII